MKRKLSYCSFILVVSILFACNGGSVSEHTSADLADSLFIPKYANHFSLAYFGGETEIRVFSDSVGGTLLYSERINPIENQDFATTSQTLFSFAQVLGLETKLTGITDAVYVSDSSIIKRLNSGSIKEIGKNQQLMLEELVALNPTTLFVSMGNQSSYPALQSSGIEIIPFLDYQEQHPLGRTEWVKVLAACYGEDENAKIWFDEVCYNYKCAKALTDSIKDQPTVFDAADYSGTWYVSGGASFMAHLYADAGASYIWKENRSSASLPLNYETVYLEAANADFWRIYIFDDTDYNMLAESNSRVEDFSAFQNRQIIVCNSVESNYHTRSITRPEVVLMDFIKVFHPDLVPDYKPQFFYKL